ncbi:nuclear transport factor 2 family protein [Dactylosporangium salmoneum]|uniref:SnoaL-like domain-containing protein n=1 Tax=Dactylosporangium salmoneum TaxID=53361 RepID=A0ABN3FBJ8_9ACTN
MSDRTDDPAVLSGLARNPAAPVPLLLRLAADPALAHPLLGREALPPEVASVLADTGDLQARRRLAAHPSTPEDIRRALAADPDPAVRAEVAGWPGSWIDVFRPHPVTAPPLPAGVYAALARDAEPAVRAALGRNRHVPLAVRLLLARDLDAEVRRCAALHDLPAPVLHRLPRPPTPTCPATGSSGSWPGRTPRCARPRPPTRRCPRGNWRGCSARYRTITEAIPIPRAAKIRSVRCVRERDTPEGPPAMELVEKYIAAWNTTDAAARRKLVEDVFAPGARYTDPLAAVTGRDEIDALIATAQAQFAGLQFTPAGPVDTHHDVARFGWHLGPQGGEPIVIGFDVVVIAEDRISAVHGFLDKVPA